jgi:hypothetical protein
MASTSIGEAKIGDAFDLIIFNHPHTGVEDFRLSTVLNRMI